MDLEFGDNYLQKLCENEKFAKKELGSPCARKLKARISDIEAATTVTDLIGGNPHPLTGDLFGQYSVGLSGGMRLIFLPMNQPTPLIGKDKIDWSKVTSVKIIKIGDYHD